MARTATVWNLSGKVVGIIASLAQVPIALKHLNSEAFGLWMTIVGIIQFLALADLGVGLGLQNLISKSFGEDNIDQIRKFIQKGFRFLLIIGCLVCLVCLPLCWLLPWVSVFQVQSMALHLDLPIALTASVMLFSANLALSIGSRLAVGLQQGWLVGAWNAAGALVTLVLVSIGAAVDAKFYFFVATTGLGQLIANIGILISITNQINIHPRRMEHSLSWSEIKEMITDGAPFVLTQLGAVVMMSLPTVAIAATIGPKAVGLYNLCQRASNAFLQLQQIPFQSLWPALTEARARQDYKWINKSFKTAQRNSIILGGAIFLLFSTIFQPVVHLWTGKHDIHFTQFTTIGFGLWTCYVTALTPMTIYLNSQSVMRGQVTGGLLSAAVFACGCSYAASVYGISGVVFAMFLSHLVFGLTPIISSFLQLQRKLAIECAVTAVSFSSKV